MDASNEIVVVAEKSQATPIIVACVFFAVVVIGSIVLGFILKKKQNQVAKKTPEDGAGNGTEDCEPVGQIFDTRRLVEAVEDIEDGIVTTRGGKTFVAAITCRGLDLYNEGLAEQVSVMKGYQNFGRLIDKPIAYRMYGKAVDIDTPKDRYAARIEESINELEVQERMLQHLKERGGNEDEIKELTEVVRRIERRVNHLGQQVEYMNFYSETDVVMDLTQDYIIDWTYDPEISEGRLGKRELFVRAKQELTAIAAQKIDALATAGVKARLCTQEEMIDKFRRHSKPISAELFKQRQVDASSFDEDIVTSDSIEEAEAQLQRIEGSSVMEQISNEESLKSFLNGRGGYEDEE